jgi:hypothetical protein
MGLLVLATISTAGWADEYHLGQGYPVGKANIAGYINLVGDAPLDGKSRLTAEDISLFVTGNFDRRLNPFFEAEISEVTVLQQGGSLFSDNKSDAVLERLYNDSYLSTEVTLRIGKMLTPVGEWNTIHASPLVWTSTRPMTTFRSFPEYTSGASLNYLPQNSSLPEAQLFVQPDGELIPKPRMRVVREYLHTAGVHLNWPTGLTDKVGVSLLHADVDHLDESQTVLGFNARRTFDRLQLEAEATYTRVGGSSPARVRDNEWGAYLLGAYALTDKCNLIARHENFADRNTHQGSRNTLLGISYKPDPAMVWKLEYVKQGGALLSINTGFSASFSVLF